MKKVVFGVPNEGKQIFSVTCECGSLMSGTEERGCDLLRPYRGVFEAVDFVMLRGEVIFCHSCGRRCQVEYDFVSEIPGYSITEINTDSSADCHLCNLKLPCPRHKPKKKT